MENGQKVGQPLGVHQFTLHMGQCRLGQTGQRLVDALNDQIGPGCHRAAGKSRMKIEMGPVGLIHQQGNAPPVTDGGNGGNVADDALIGGTGEHHQTDVRVLGQSRFHRFGRHGRGHRKGRVHRRRQVERLQMQQFHGVIDRFVTATGHKNPAAEGGRGGHGRQNAAGGTVDQIEGAGGTVQPGGQLHAVFQNPLGFVEIVEAVDFRNVQLPGQFFAAQGGALVAGHVHGQETGGIILGQPFQQIIVHCHDQSPWKSIRSRMAAASPMHRSQGRLS